MAKIFLRSGSLDALLALGENGQPLWLSALQLRETLRLRQQPQIADCLAIPQPNDAGDRLDWYSPVSGKVTSWAAASNGARAAALTQLRACQQVMLQLSEQACASAKPSQRLFGALLSKALQFPDEFHVYLVGGRPVITFWGFVSLEKRAHKDALDCLQLAEEDEMPALGLSRLAAPAALAASAAPVAPAAVAAATPAIPPAPSAPPASLSEPLVMPAIPPLQIVDEPEEAVNTVTESAPTAATSPAASRSRGGMRYIWALPVVAMLVAIGVQWLPPMGDAEPQASAPAAQPAAMPADSASASAQPAAASVPVSTVAQTTTPAAAVTASAPETTPSAAATAANASPAPATSAVQPAASASVGQPAAPVAGQASAGTVQSTATALSPATAAMTQGATATTGGTLPLAPATHAAPAIAPEPEPEADLPPPDKDDLVLPAEAVRLGSPKFLNGNWRVIVQQAAPLTGRPPQLKYQLRNGTGTARITQGDGVTCRADVEAAVMPSGNLVIKSRNTARCSDGTRYRMPELLCRQGLTGAAQCNGSYNDSNNTVLPMTMKRETR